MIKITVTAQNGTTVQLEIPTDGTTSITTPCAPVAVSTLKLEQIPIPEAAKPQEQDPAPQEPEPVKQFEPELEPQPEQPERPDDINNFQFPCENGGFYVAPPTLVRDFLLAFGETHVRTEFLKARSFLIDNPRELKTQRGMGRFLNARLCRNAGVAKTPIRARAQTTLTTDGNQVSEGW
jgi:hypothetical protein